MASIFLYKSVPRALIAALADVHRSILGWSAFAGIIVLAVAVPLNSFLSKRSVKVRTDAMGASH